MVLEDARREYGSLPPLPDSGWDTTWVDRLRTWDDFLQKGSDMAMVLRMNRITAPDYEYIKNLAPELHDLVLQVFPLTPEQEKFLEEWRSELDFS